MEQSTSMNRIQSWQKALTPCGDCHCMNGAVNKHEQDPIKALTYCGDCHCMNGAVNKHEQDPILAEGTHRLWKLPLHEWSSQQAWTGSNPGRRHSLSVDRHFVKEGIYQREP